jgi:hypothetical protein
MQKLAPVPPEAFEEIISELKRRPLPVNQYRDTAGVGRSTAFGIVNRRCLPPDMSRECWNRAALYGLLEKYADRFCPFSDWTSITLNQNYAAAPHRDKGNHGLSYLVAFGDYRGGELVIHEGDCSGTHDIQYKPVLFPGSELLHSVRPFEGERYSLVIYRAGRGDETTLVEKRRQYTASLDEETNKVRLFKKNSENYWALAERLPHPLKGRVKISPA